MSADHLSNEQIDAFLRGDLSTADSEVFERHLAECAECVGRAERGEADDPLHGLLRAAAHRAEEGHGDERADTPLPTPPRYEILEEIGRGGMGVVYRARQSALGRVVALKQVRLGRRDDPDELVRFETEALAAASLRHPGIVQVYDVGWLDGEPYLAMELVEGGSLADALRRGPLPSFEAAALAAQVARAVQHAHEAGIVHRDLKPANILRNPDGTPRIGDFGLAKRLDAPGGPTQTGSVLGTPSYMAPEQARGGACGPLADVHALGAVLYECLTGRPPFHAATALETLEQVCSCEPVPPRRVQPGVPLDLQTIALKCLEKDPRRRYPSAAALADDLERFIQGRPIEARPVGPVTRTFKWARRRPSQAALALLGLGVVFGSFLALLTHESRLKVEIDRANEAARVAGVQRALADANYREAREAIRNILERLSDPKMAGIPRRAEIQASQTEAALRFYERVLGVAESPDPAVRLDTALAAREAANLQISLGRIAPAEANLRRSLRILDDLAGERPDDPAILRERMTCWLKLGVMLQGRENDRAFESLERALGLAEHLDRIEGQTRSSRADLAWCEHNVGSGLMIAGKHQQARPHLARAASLRRSLLEEIPEDLNTEVMLASALVNLGLIDAASDPKAAEASYAEASALLEKALTRSTDPFETTLNLGELLNNWANLAAARGDHTVALARFARGLELVEPVRRLEPTQQHPRRVAMSLSGSRANLLGALGRHAEALADWDRVIECNDVPANAPGYHLMRGFSLARSGDHRRAAADLAAFERVPAAPEKRNGSDLYNLACLLALMADAASRDAGLSPEERKRLSDDFTNRAFDWLRRCASTGFLKEPANLAQAQKDTDLDFLRTFLPFGQIVRGEP